MVVKAGRSQRQYAVVSLLNRLARAYHLELPRAIANLTGCDEIQSVHLVEALQYRPKLMS